MINLSESMGLGRAQTLQSDTLPTALRGVKSLVPPPIFLLKQFSNYREEILLIIRWAKQFKWKFKSLCDIRISKFAISLEVTPFPQHPQANCLPFSRKLFNIYSCTHSCNGKKLTSKCFLLNLAPLFCQLA